jgi:DNA-binding IclR family transcriptional regulator
MKSVIPTEVKDFILRNIASVEEMEVLFFLRDRRDSAWTAAALSAQLRSSVPSIDQRLSELLARGLVARGEASGSYRYWPKDAALEELVAKLAQYYAERRISIIELIYTRPSDKLRSFADAFRIKEEKD